MAKANRWTWCQRVRFQKQPQPCRTPHRHRARLTLFGAILTRNRKVGSRHLEERQSVPCLKHGDKLVQSTCILTMVPSFTHVRSSIQDKEYRCLILESTQRVELAYNVRFKLPEGRTFRVLLHAACVQKPFSLLVVSPSRGVGVIFPQTQVHCTFLTRSRLNTANHSCTRKRARSLSKG